MKQDDLEQARAEVLTWARLLGRLLRQQKRPDSHSVFHELNAARISLDAACESYSRALEGPEEAAAATTGRLSVALQADASWLCKLLREELGPFTAESTCWTTDQCRALETAIQSIEADLRFLAPERGPKGTP